MMKGRTVYQQFGGGARMSDADFNEPNPNPYIASLEEQARIKGTKPVTSIHELAADVFESDEELDEFLAWLYDMRHSS
jgi:hypothetical protein